MLELFTLDCHWATGQSTNHLSGSWTDADSSQWNLHSASKMNTTTAWCQKWTWCGWVFQLSAWVSNIESSVTILTERFRKRLIFHRYVITHLTQMRIETWSIDHFLGSQMTHYQYCSIRKIGNSWRSCLPYLFVKFLSQYNTSECDLAF